jgi:hypothetical protein
MPFTSETARIAGRKAKGIPKRKPPESETHAPQVLLNKALKLLSNQIDKGNVQAASRVLGVLYDAGVKPTTRDDNLGEAIKSLLSPAPMAPNVLGGQSAGQSPATGSEQGTEAPKKEGGS